MEYLSDMYVDSYFPNFLVDKIKVEIEKVYDYLSDGHKDISEIQTKLDDMTLAINELQEEFEDNESEIETVARDSIAETVMDMLAEFNIDIDIETALSQRDF